MKTKDILIGVGLWFLTAFLFALAIELALNHYWRDPEIEAAHQAADKAAAEATVHAERANKAEQAVEADKERIVALNAELQTLKQQLQASRESEEQTKVAAARENAELRRRTSQEEERVVTATDQKLADKAVTSLRAEEPLSKPEISVIGPARFEANRSAVEGFTKSMIRLSGIRTELKTQVTLTEACRRTSADAQVSLAKCEEAKTRQASEVQNLEAANTEKDAELVDKQTEVDNLRREAALLDSKTKWEKTKVFLEKATWFAAGYGTRTLQDSISRQP